MSWKIIFKLMESKFIEKSREIDYLLIFLWFHFSSKLVRCSNCEKAFLDSTELKEHQLNCNNGNVEVGSPEVQDTNEEVYFDVTETESLFDNDTIILSVTE